MDKLLNKTGKYYIIVFVVLLAAASFISPLGDDFIYFVAPNPNFTLADLLPEASFWRPFDVLIGALNGVFPSLFPMLNFTLVIFGHVMSAYFIEKILTKKGIEKKYAFFGAMFFAFSSACIAVTASPDSINQAFSLLFGLIGMYSYIRKDNYVYLIYVFISLLWKESGISWLFVIPLFSTTETFGTFKGIFKDKKKLLDFIFKIIAGILTSAAYFALRFSLLGKIELGNDTRYKLSLFSFSTLKNLVYMTASAIGGFDTVTVFSDDKKPVIFIITTVLSCIFFVFMLIKALMIFKKNPEWLYTIAVFAASLIILCAPQAALSKTSEMHAYPVVFLVACVYAYIFNYSEKKSGIRTAALMLCIFTAFAGASFHKYQSLYRFSAETDALTDSICSYYNDSSKRLLILFERYKAGYSIYSQCAFFGLWDGDALISRFGWQDIPRDSICVENEEQGRAFAAALYNNYDCILYIPAESVSAQLIK